MPNNSYLRSVRRERALVNELRDLGYQCARSAGSKSCWDVYAFHPVRKEVLLIQVKTVRGARGVKRLDKKVYDNVTVITSTMRYS